MKNILIIITSIFLFSCSNNKHEKHGHDHNYKSEIHSCTNPEVIKSKLPKHSKGDKYTLIKNGRIFNGKDNKLTEGSILIKNNIIIAVGKIDNFPVGEIEQIDAKHNVITPGFIDAHTHMALIAPFDKLENEYSGVYVGAAGGQMAEDMLYRGFTTVRDAGGACLGIQRAIDDGWFPGPRIFGSGAFITQTSGHLDMRDRTTSHSHFGHTHSHAEQVGHYYAVDGEAEMLAAVRQNFRNGATQIKLATNGGISAIYSPLDIDQFTDAELKAAHEATKSFGSYIMVHAYYDKAVSRAIDHGAKSIEHGHMMSEESMKKMAKNDVYLVVEALMSMADAPDSFTAEQVEKFNLMKASFANLIKMAKKYKIKIAFGSDVFLSKEMYKAQALEWTARSSLFTPFEIMQQATVIGAELIALSGNRNRYKEGKLGVIEVGAYADLNICSKNPLQDITVLSNPEENLVLIMKDGTVYKNIMQ